MIPLIVWLQYINNNTSLGIISNLVDLSILTDIYQTIIVWDNNSNENLVLLGADLTALDTGFENTQTIVDALGLTNYYAARYCDELNVNGYSDWFLPSKEELKKILHNTIEIGNITYGVYDPISYWSSTENDFATAVIVGFQKDDGIFGTGEEIVLTDIFNKNIQGPKTRPVRYFYKSFS